MEINRITARLQRMPMEDYVRNATFGMATG